MRALPAVLLLLALIVPASAAGHPPSLKAAKARAAQVAAVHVQRQAGSTGRQFQPPRQIIRTAHARHIEVGYLGGPDLQAYIVCVRVGHGLRTRSSVCRRTVAPARAAQVAAGPPLPAPDAGTAAARTRAVMNRACHWVEAQQTTDFNEQGVCVKWTAKLSSCAGTETFYPKPGKKGQPAQPVERRWCTGTFVYDTVPGTTNLIPCFADAGSPGGGGYRIRCVGDVYVWTANNGDGTYGLRTRFMPPWRYYGARW